MAENSARVVAPLDQAVEKAHGMMACNAYVHQVGFFFVFCFFLLFTDQHISIQYTEQGMSTNDIESSIIAAEQIISDYSLL
jgi:hypothetical protein